MKAILCDWCGERADDQCYAICGVEIKYVDRGNQNQVDLCYKCYKQFVDKCYEKAKEKKK